MGSTEERSWPSHRRHQDPRALLPMSRNGRCQHVRDPPGCKFAMPCHHGAGRASSPGAGANRVSPSPVTSPDRVVSSAEMSCRQSHVRDTKRVGPATRSAVRHLRMSSPVGRLGPRLRSRLRPGQLPFSWGYAVTRRRTTGTEERDAEIPSSRHLRVTEPARSTTSSATRMT